MSENSHSVYNVLRLIRSHSLCARRSNQVDRDNSGLRAFKHRSADRSGRVCLCDPSPIHGQDRYDAVQHVPSLAFTENRQSLAGSSYLRESASHEARRRDGKSVSRSIGRIPQKRRVVRV